MMRQAWQGGHSRRRHACARCQVATRSTQRVSGGRWPMCSRCAPLTAAERLLMAVAGAETLAAAERRIGR